MGDGESCGCGRGRRSSMQRSRQHQQWRRRAALLAVALASLLDDSYAMVAPRGLALAAGSASRSLQPRSQHRRTCVVLMTGAAHPVQSPCSHFPLLITIGPQCAGKTTTLLALGQSLGGARICDVAIDDHPDVYYKLPTACALDPDSITPQQDVLLFDKTVSERMADYTVVGKCLVAKRLEGLLTADEFREQWLSSVEFYPYPDGEVEELWIAAVEAAVAAGLRMETPTVDLFVPNGHYPRGVRDSNRRLRQECSRHPGPVAWGNTNTKSKDYREALECAQAVNRPVRYLRWGHELPAVPLRDLFARDLRRFAATGRYVPPQAVAAALRRVEHLYARTDGGDPALLTAAAGFQMGAGARVRAVSRPAGAALPPRQREQQALRARRAAPRPQRQEQGERRHELRPLPQEGGGERAQQQPQQRQRRQAAAAAPQQQQQHGAHHGDGGSDDAEPQHARHEHHSVNGDAAVLLPDPRPRRSAAPSPTRPRRSAAAAAGDDDAQQHSDHVAAAAAAPKRAASRRPSSARHGSGGGDRVDAAASEGLFMFSWGGGGDRGGVKFAGGAGAIALRRPPAWQEALQEALRRVLEVCCY
ncbi:hypothetical protein JKP88DRAFT_267700 [Tribonema minus]|uniref:Uncharacterized protein n=1 Tax=Tribonema minus TaxID=303371 RepID=A0A835Z5Q0_9STRA|nr:hypothetical protein JKP88DRAFT_267700 [Tribonema minus]